MNSGFTDGLRVGWGGIEWEEGRKRRRLEAVTHKTILRSILALSFPLHYMLYVVADLAEHGEVFNVQLAPQPSKAWCILHLVCALEFNSG